MKKWLNEKKVALKQQAQQLFVQNAERDQSIPFCVCDGGCPRCVTESLKKEGVAIKVNETDSKSKSDSQDMVESAKVSEK